MEPLIGIPSFRHRGHTNPRLSSLILGFLSLMVVIVTACGPSAISTGVPTPAPLATASSLPTLTPQPTAVTLPTLVPQPTVIGLPALTPQPTVIGLPAVTPLPTVVGLPTVNPDAPGQPGLVEQPAPIESVAIEVTGADPTLANLILVTGLPNACYSFGAYDLSRDEDTIRLEVNNLRLDDPGLMCAQVYGMVTTRIPLRDGIVACATYQVVVNGRTFSVQALGPNVRCGDASAGTSIEVGIGETVPIGSEGLALTLLEVSEDSRCPTDVACIWAGRATILVSLRRDGSNLGDFSLTLGEGAAAPVVEREGHRIRLTALEPNPISTRQPTSDQYLAILSVTKS